MLHNRWYRLAKEEFGQERYVKEFGSKGEVRLKFRLTMLQAGILFGDKDRYGMCQDGRCELCYEDVKDMHFLLHCEEYAGDRRLLGMIKGTEGTEEWNAEW